MQARRHEVTCAMRRCPECDQVLHSQAALNIHLKYKHSNLGCPECLQLFNDSIGLTAHMRENHTTADKIVMLSRSNSSWKASTLAGKDLFEIDGSDLVQIGNLREKISEAIGGATTQMLSFLVDGREVGDAAALENLSVVIIKRHMLVEQAAKTQALEEMHAARLAKGDSGCQLLQAALTGAA